MSTFANHHKRLRLGKAFMLNRNHGGEGDCGMTHQAVLDFEGGNPDSTDDECSNRGTEEGLRQEPVRWWHKSVPMALAGTEFVRGLGSVLRT